LQNGGPLNQRAAVRRFGLALGQAMMAHCGAAVTRGIVETSIS
jgi:hypothetical protein